MKVVICWASPARGIRGPPCPQHRSRVGPSTVGHLPDLPGYVVVLVQVKHLDAIAFGPLKAFGHEVHPDDTKAKVLGYAAGHVSDRTEPQDRDAAASGISA